MDKGVEGSKEKEVIRGFAPRFIVLETLGMKSWLKS